MRVDACSTNPNNIPTEDVFGFFLGIIPRTALDRAFGITVTRNIASKTQNNILPRHQE